MVVIKMPEFHSLKPIKIFSGKNMDVFIESDYPREMDFDGKKYYVAYLTKNNDIEALCAGNTKKELLKELYEWKVNPLVFRLIENDIRRYESY